MPFDYDPKDAENTLPEGEYDAMLKKVNQQTSNQGNPMLVLTVVVYDNAGEEHALKDYITHASLFKLKQVALALGQRDAFEAGRFDAEQHEGANIRVKLKVEKSDEYGDQNRIAAYKGSALAGTNSANPKPEGGAFRGINRAAPPRQPAGTATPPYGDEQVFSESDVPF